MLVVIALLVAAMPCCHAADHDLHEHDADTAEICAAHECACHACDEARCAAGLEMHQQPSVVSITVATPPSPFYIFVFKETRPVIRQASSPASGTLACLQTVQLLI